MGVPAGGHEGFAVLVEYEDGFFLWYAFEFVHACRLLSFRACHVRFSFVLRGGSGKRNPSPPLLVAGRVALG